jgi:hypothetical protein
MVLLFGHIADSAVGWVSSCPASDGQASPSPGECVAQKPNRVAVMILRDEVGACLICLPRPAHPQRAEFRCGYR